MWQNLLRKGTAQKDRFATDDDDDGGGGGGGGGSSGKESYLHFGGAMFKFRPHLGSRWCSSVLATKHRDSVDNHGTHNRFLPYPLQFIIH
jgi:hypothetical protein